MATAQLPAQAAIVWRAMDIRTRQPHYANLGIADAGGKLVCSAMPHKQAIGFADRPWFQEVERTRRFTTSDFLVGRATGKPSIVFAPPLPDQQGGFRGMVFASLDFLPFAASVADGAWPDNTAVTLIDRQDIIPARHPDHDNLLIARTAVVGVKQDVGIDEGERRAFTAHWHRTGPDSGRQVPALPFQPRRRLASALLVVAPGIDLLGQMGGHLFCAAPATARPGCNRKYGSDCRRSG